VFGGGSTGPDSTSAIQYVTIASTGNATSFGSLLAANAFLATCASSTRGVFGGGGGASIYNTIDYVTIETLGNATDFGDLTVTRDGASGLSNNHGGLG
jgi:hypothetical protein